MRYAIPAGIRPGSKRQFRPDTPYISLVTRRIDHLPVTRCRFLYRLRQVKEKYLSIVLTLNADHPFLLDMHTIPFL